MHRRTAAWVSVVAAVAMSFGGASTAAARQPIARGCGDAWTVAPQPAFTGSGGLDDIAALSVTDAWAVGGVFTQTDQVGHTLIEHHDGTSWSAVPSVDGPNSSQSSLSGVVPLAANDVWAAGTYIRADNLIRTLIEHWDGTVWSRVKSPNAGHPAGGELSDIDGVVADDVWAVGGYGQGAPGRTLIEHWDGTAWTVVPSPNKGPYPNSLTDVVAVAPVDAWAIGTWFTKAFVDRTLVLHWDGTKWRRVPSPNAGSSRTPNDLESISAVAADDIWAVGTRGLHTLTVHWDGVSWSVNSSPTPGGNADLAGVTAVGPADVWAVGGRVDRVANAIQTLVEHWDGTAWSVVESANKGPSDNHLWGVAAAPGRMFAVGYRFAGSGLGSTVPLTLERCGV
ncbi:MAG: hypothetical protein ACRDH7_05500 [Actinomycetota bacterium]